MPGVAVDQVLVDLVGDHPDAVLHGPAADRLDLLRRVDGAGRVRRRVEQQHLGARGPRGLQLLDGDQVTGRLVGGHHHRNTARQGDRLGVGGPVRRGQQDLVARVDQGLKRLVDGLLAAIGHQHLTGLHGVVGIAPGLRGDGLAQLRQAGRRAVAVVLRVGAGGDGGVHDRLRRREVRLAGAEPDHRSAGRLEGLRLGVHGQRGGLADPADPRGDPRLGLLVCLRCGHTCILADTTVLQHAAHQRRSCS